MRFERSVWIDVTAMVLCALAAYVDWRTIPELEPIATPRWHVFLHRLPAPPPQVVNVEDTQPVIKLGAVVSRDTSAHFARGTFCVLSARLEVDDISEAADGAGPWPCSLSLSCASEHPFAVSHAECRVSRPSGRAAAKAPYALSSEDEWGTCNHRTSFVIDGARGTIRIDEDDRENLNEPERDTLELAIVGGVMDP